MFRSALPLVVLICSLFSLAYPASLSSLGRQVNVVLTDDCAPAPFYFYPLTYLFDFHRTFTYPSLQFKWQEYHNLYWCGGFLERPVDVWPDVCKNPLMTWDEFDQVDIVSYAPYLHLYHPIIEVFDLSKPYWSWYHMHMCAKYSYVDLAIGIQFPILGILLSCILLLYNHARDFSMLVYTWLLVKCSSPLLHDYRVQFRKMCSQNQPVFIDPKHPHPQSATNRKKANRMIDSFAFENGLDRFDHSGNGMHIGSRLFYFAKDLRFNFSYNMPSNNSLETMIDVDYYVPMHTYLNGANVFMLYTYSPTTVSGSNGEVFHWFNGDDTVTMKLSGGASYTHALWDYDCDELVIDHWWGSSVYLVDSYDCGLDRKIVMLMPIRNVYGILGWFLPGKRLYRRHVVDDGVSMIRHDGMVSIGKTGMISSVSLSEEVYSAAFTRLSTSLKPYISDVERVFSSMDVEHHVTAAPLFFDLYTKYSMPELSDVTFSTKVKSNRIDDQHSYQSVDGLTYEDGKQSMRSMVKDPFMTGYAPVVSYNNDLSCVLGRIKNVKNNSACPFAYISYKQELIDLLVEALGIKDLAPMDGNAVRDRMRNASNLAVRIDRSEVLLPLQDRVHVQSFQKAEAYPKIAPPRNISTLPPGHNFRLAEFTYAISGFLKTLPFYGPGKHPRDLADRVLMIGRVSNFINNTDISKLDGSASEYLNSFYSEFMQTVFAADFKDEITNLLQAEDHANAHTANGVAYSVNDSITSGSSSTSQRGTFINILLAFSALRQQGHNPQSAFANLGIYFGDDGMTPNLQGHVMQKVSGRYGILVKSELVFPGQVLGFLGRVYLDPFLSNQTIADVPRQLKKLHLTDCPKLVPDAIIMRRRALAYLITDPNTPILSNWARAVIRVTDAMPEASLHVASIAAREDSYWLRFEGPFYSPSVDRAHDVVALALNVTSGEVLEICNKIDQATSLQDTFVSIPGQTTAPAEVTVVIGHEIVQSKPTASHQSRVEDNAKLSTAICHDFQRGQCKRKKCKFEHTKAKDEICRAFLNNSCRFGDRCFKKHPRGPDAVPVRN